MPWLHHTSGTVTSTHSVGGWMGPSASLDGSEKRKIFCHCCKWNHDS